MEILRLSYIHFFIFINLFILCENIDCENCRSDGFNCFKRDGPSGQLCDQKCKPKYGELGKCFLCDFEGYYYIGQTTIDVNSVDTCISGCPQDYFIIDQTKECVPSSTTPDALKKMGSVYYKNCPLY